MDAVKLGYGGIFHNNIVDDRRKYNSLIPLLENIELGIPEPKKHDVKCKEGLIRMGDVLTTCEWCKSNE